MAVIDAVGGDRLALAAQAEALYSDPIPVHLISAPTLVLAGDADPLTRGADQLAAAMPRATLTTLPGDHLGVPPGQRGLRDRPGRVLRPALSSPDRPLPRRAGGRRVSSPGMS
ncbi:MAG TPA: hypothetical protein VK586_21160 [Streptosporangiaceae bacterium]|nr:hypothetical protein [Streptosporangiaceae bacterium]